MAVAGLLAQYMSVKNQLTYCEQQKTRWDNLATAMTKKLSEQEKGEEKWNSQYDSAESACNDTTELKLNGNVVLKKEDSGYGGWKPSRVANRCGLNTSSKEAFASSFASKKVPKYDPALLEEYTDLDMEYETMSAMYETLVTELEAQRDGLKERVSADAQDTHILGGS